VTAPTKNCFKKAPLKVKDLLDKRGLHAVKGGTELKRGEGAEEKKGEEREKKSNRKTSVHRKTLLV